MDDKELENRLEFLKKSYNRIPSENHSEDVMKRIAEQDKEQQQKGQSTKKTKWQKLGVWAVGVASIVVFGLIGASFLLTEDKNEANLEQSELTKEEISEQILIIYERERESFRKKLDLPEEEFSAIPFIQNADMFIENNSKLQQLSGQEDPEEFIKKLVTDSYFVFPMEMINELVEKNQVMPEIEEYEFLEKYHRAIINYQQYGNYGLEKYQEELEKLKVNEKYYLYNLDAQRESLPVELQNILRIIESQGLHLVTTNEEKRLEVRFNRDKVFNPHIEKFLSPLANSYMMWMKGYPINEDPMEYTFEDTMDPLIHLESIMAVKDQYDHYSADVIGDKELTYRRVLYELIKGEQVLNSNGTVDEKYQDMWVTALNEYPDSLAAFIIKPIVEEFMASGWTESSSWEAFSIDDINANLKKFMVGELTREDNQATLIDDDFVQKVHGLYKLYADSKDPALLKEATPEEIVGLYYYSKQLKDYDTVYSIYLKDGAIQIPKDEYMEANHVQIEDIRKEFSSFLSRPINEDETVVMLTLQEGGNMYKEEESIGFQLTKTENGWRPRFMPTQ